MELYDLAEGADVSCLKVLVFSAALHFLLPFLERFSWKRYEDGLFCRRFAAHLVVLALLNFPLFFPTPFPLRKRPVPFPLLLFFSFLFPSHLPSPFSFLPSSSKCAC